MENPFNDAEPLLPPQDVVPRSAPDPDAVERLERMRGQFVRVTETRFTRHGVETVDIGPAFLAERCDD